MKRLLFVFALLTVGCSARSEVQRLTAVMRAACMELAGKPEFEAKDGITTRFTCQMAAPTAWTFDK